MRRVMLGLDQRKLGDGTGYTFHPLQKYEKGIYGIGASRSMATCRLRDVVPALGETVVGEPDEVDSLVSAKDGFALNHAFAQVEDPLVRKKLIVFANVLVEHAADHGSYSRQIAKDINAVKPERRI